MSGVQRKLICRLHCCKIACKTRVMQFYCNLPKTTISGSSTLTRFCEIKRRFLFAQPLAALWSDFFPQHKRLKPYLRVSFSCLIGPCFSIGVVVSKAFLGHRGLRVTRLGLWRLILPFHFKTIDISY
jgi:hypothetical protein